MPITTSELVKQKVEAVMDNQKYPHLGDAFSHWYLVEKFGLSDSDAMDACRIAGAGDKGLDAYFIDDETEDIKCFQFKFSESGEYAMGPDEIIKIYNTITYSTDRSNLTHVTGKTARVAFEEILDKWEQNYDITFYVVVFGHITKDGQKELEKIEKTLPVSATNTKRVQVIPHDSTAVSELLVDFSKSTPIFDKL